MLSYVIHDAEVFNALERNRIRYKRSDRNWFFVAIKSLRQAEVYTLKDGTKLTYSGAELRIQGETGIDMIPGRYIGVYEIGVKDMIQALIDNGYTVNKITETAYEINAFIPKSRQCRLPDRTIIESDARGVLTLVN